MYGIRRNATVDTLSCYYKPSVVVLYYIKYSIVYSTVDQCQEDYKNYNLDKSYNINVILLSQDDFVSATRCSNEPICCYDIHNGIYLQLYLILFCKHYLH